MQDAIPAVDFWEDSHGENLSANTQPNIRKQIPTTHTNLDLTHIEHVPSSGTHYVPMLCWSVFEENNAVSFHAVSRMDGITALHLGKESKAYNANIVHREAGKLAATEKTGIMDFLNPNLQAMTGNK